MSVTPAMLAVQTTWPASCSARTGPNTSAPCTTPRTLTSNTHSQTSGGGVEHRSDRRHAGVEAHDVHATEPLERLVAQTPGVVERTHVVGHAQHAVATTERVERLGDRLLLDVGDDDVHARLQEAGGHRLPMPPAPPVTTQTLSVGSSNQRARHGQLTITTRPAAADGCVGCGCVRSGAERSRDGGGVA